MSTPRKEPYIWPTWITKILAGEQSCEWATWFKAHYQGYEKAPRDGDLTAWTARHTELLLNRAAELRNEGYEVFVEDQNKFTLKGKSCTIGGKPDIVAIKMETDSQGVDLEDVVVVDAKGGKPRDSDHFQVLIYMLILPLTHPRCLGKAVRGEIQYIGERLDIDVLPNRQRQMILNTIERIASETPAVLAPSFRECQWCDLTKADCSSRVEKDTPVTKTGMF